MEAVVGVLFIVFVVWFVIFAIRSIAYIMGAAVGAAFITFFIAVIASAADDQMSPDAIIGTWFVLTILFVIFGFFFR